MKVAFCFFGHFRRFENTHASWNQFIDRYNADVFIHTWNHRGIYTKGDTPEIWNGLSDNPQVVDFGSLAKYLELFKPRSFLVDYYPDYEYVIANAMSVVYDVRKQLGTRINDRPLAFMSMCYSRFKVMNLVQHSLENYDVVVLTRPDVMIQGRETIPIPENDQLILETKFNYSNTSDLIMVGTHDTISEIGLLFFDVVSALNEELNDILENRDAHRLLSIIDPHLSLRRYCEKREIEVKEDKTLKVNLFR